MATVAPIRFSEQGRSGTRMLMAMPVTLTGNGAAGPFEEKTRTVVINRTGCKLMSELSLAVGAKMTLSIGSGKRIATVDIVWVGDKKGKQTEIGVDFETPDATFWGVMFPEDPAVASTAPAVQTQAAPAKPVARAAAPVVATVVAPAPAAARPQATQHRAPTPAPPSPAITASVPARIPPPQPPAQSGTVPVKPKPSPTAPGAHALLETVKNVIPISNQRPQIVMNEESLKGIGGDLLLGTVQHLVREAFQEVLSQVVDDFDRYCTTSIERAKNAALAEMQERLRVTINEAMQPAVDAGVAGARAQLDSAAREIAAKHSQQLESSMVQALESTEKVLEKNMESRTAVHTAAFDQRLSNTASQFCQELARRMTQSHVA